MRTMKAVVFKGKDRIAIEEVPRPTPGFGEAVIRITTTTICGTDVHIVRGEYPVRPGLILGHEPVGVIDSLGAGLEGLYTIGQRVIVGAITPCGQCFYCLNVVHSQCGCGIGGWRFGNMIKGASLIIGVDGNSERLAVARRLGANVTLNTRDGDPVPEIKRLTEGRGVDVAIEALGRQETFENALRAIRPGGILSSLGVYSGKLTAPYEALHAGLGDQRIVTTLCPGGKERMRRLMAMIAHQRVDLSPLVTHYFPLDDIQEAYEVFSQQRHGVLKVALYPDASRMPAARRTSAVPAAVLLNTV